MKRIQWIPLLFGLVASAVVCSTMGPAHAAPRPPSLYADSAAVAPAEKPAETPPAVSSAPPSDTSAATPAQTPGAKSKATPKSKKGPPAGKTPAVVDSLALLEHVVARDSSKFDNLYKLGVMYIDHDRLDDAVTVLTKATKLRPKSSAALVNLGAAHDAKGQATQAQGYYRQALDISPGDSLAMCRLASSLYAQSKYQEAIDLLRQAIQEKPGSFCAYFYLGVAFADAGIYRDAIRMWKKVVDLAPNSSEAMSAKESIDVLEKFVQKQ